VDTLGIPQRNHQPEMKAVSQNIIAVVGLGYVGLPLAAETVISPIGLTQQ
jgi:hypothetical protein